MNGELEIMWKDAVVAYVMVLSRFILLDFSL
jgi:hypothetical protein